MVAGLTAILKNVEISMGLGVLGAVSVQLGVFFEGKEKERGNRKKDRFLPICGKKRSKITRKGGFLRV